MTPEQLGRIIRKTRQQHNLRQEQLAAAAGVGLRFLIELEHGKPTARLGKAIDVLKALGLDLTVTSRPSIS